jgi:hypothetical protein
MDGGRHAGGGIETVVHCGPVALCVSADSAALRERALAELEQFTVHWDGPRPVRAVHLHATEARSALGEGRFLQCSRMRVDKTALGLVATCRWGAAARSDAGRRRWDLYIPPVIRDADGVWTEDAIEDLLELVLTTAWRELGWIPLHAGAVVRERRCALLVAPSGGGKSTATAAMLHRGWRALGDDKALVALDGDGRPQVRGLAGRVNLDPRTATWFPELGDLEALPRLSQWTAKRQVAIEDIWHDGVASPAAPTHLVQLRRVRERRPTRVEPLSASEVLAALLRQTVIPADRDTARGILTVLARTARSLRGVCLEIGEDAYRDPAALDVLEQTLGCI